MRYYNNYFTPKPTVKDRIIRFLRSNNPTNRLITINIGIYLLVLLLSLFSKTFLFLHDGSDQDIAGNFLSQWFGVSSNLETLITRPWTLITSIFLHLSFWHIFFNMIMLWVAGWIFSQFIPPKKIYTVYLLGGMVGNLLFILSFNYFPVFKYAVSHSVALGASGGVLAVLAAVATQVPNYPIRLLLIGEVRLKWLAIVLIILDIINIRSGNSGGHFAHLGGVMFGFLFVFIPLLKSKIRLPRPKKRKFNYHINQDIRPKTDEQYNAEIAAYRKKVDTVLDKVAKSGYSSLSKAEKEFLFNTSNKKDW